MDDSSIKKTWNIDDFINATVDGWDQVNQNDRFSVNQFIETYEGVMFWLFMKGLRLTPVTTKELANSRHKTKMIF